MGARDGQTRYGIVKRGLSHFLLSFFLSFAFLPLRLYPFDIILVHGYIRCHSINPLKEGMSL